MTRCLDCGSERIADQCPCCGLTSAAAEVMFRRRLLKRTAVFLAGSLAFPYVSQIYPPLDLDLMLVFFGMLFFVGLKIKRNLLPHYSGEPLQHAGNRSRDAPPDCSFLARWAENRTVSRGFR